MNERLEAFSISRGGVFTAEQAARFDVDRHDLACLRSRGQICRVRRDAYVLGEVWRAATPEERLALRTRAVLAARVSGIASHQSALALHGLPLLDPEREVDVVDDVVKPRVVSGVRITPPRKVGTVRFADALAWVMVGGCPSLPISTAVVVTAARDGLLSGLVPLEAALRTRQCTLEHVKSALGVVPLSPRGRQRAEGLLAHADPASESVGETRTHVLLSDLGFRWRSQVRITDAGGAFVARVDFLVEGQVVVEFDGALKYDGLEGRAALVAEKLREDRLRALGYAVVRLTWADLDHPGHVAAKIRQALGRLTA
ncbi:type IV toxin-antitoxin system AbiEi family antitoxin domain-containing protein [Janibacter sp. GXQ6167]|uniref:type IV toxin-antitoxin system AbiEi family antitoxin domain-containing protein n=1 Tax=Janibacter sp. GXQ6167 TaxID=3240791 RepID=UPI003524109B